MRRSLLVTPLVIALLAGCGSDDNGGDDAAAEGRTEIALVQQNGSGQDGTATLSQVDDATTRVEITLATPGESPQPAHIHRGSCDRLDAQPEYPLENVVDGESASEVNVALDDLIGQNFAINVHKSEAEIETYVSCGEVASGPATTETSEDETETETETSETETGETETEDETETETGESGGRDY